jgi:hypothetical protein
MFIRKKKTKEKKHTHLPHVYRTYPHVRSSGGFTTRTVVPCGITCGRARAGDPPGATVNLCLHATERAEAGRVFGADWTPQAAPVIVVEYVLTMGTPSKLNVIRKNTNRVFLLSL